MELKLLKRLPALCKKYKYAILILIIGFVLMMFPVSKSKQTDISNEKERAVIQIPLEERLANILSQVDGAGDVRVVLTISEGEKTLFQSDEDNAQGENEQSSRRDTVTITDSTRNETGLIKQVLPARYQGAIIVCQGADDLSVRLEIVDAVSKLTGLGANCISVLKMK